MCGGDMGGVTRTVCLVRGKRPAARRPLHGAAARAHLLHAGAPLDDGQSGGGQVADGDAAHVNLRVWDAGGSDAG